MLPNVEDIIFRYTHPGASDTFTRFTSNGNPSPFWLTPDKWWAKSWHMDTIIVANEVINKRFAESWDAQIRFC